MHLAQKEASRKGRWSAVRMIGALGLLWTMVLSVLLYGNIKSTKRHTRDMMRLQALSFLQALMVTESWRIEHEKAPDSPAGVEARLTLVDMVRQVTRNTVNGDQFSYHVAGLNPVKPAHRPDSWEAAALEGFQKGRREWFELIANTDRPRKTFRYMAPLLVEPQCASCHADQSGQVGRVRGGISVAIPADPFLTSQSEEISHLGVTYSLIWLIGFVGLGSGTRQLMRKRELAEAALETARQNEERFRVLFEEAPVAYHEIDARGIVRRVNRVECELLGFRPEEMLGRQVWEFVPPEEQGKSQEAVRRKVAGEQPLTPFRREYLRSDGTRVTLEIHENLIRDADGAVAGIRSTLLDVTKRVRAEQALARRTQELIRSNAELEQFAYVASHDLQEPLRKILAFGDRLKAHAEAALGDQGRDYLERMQKAASRMQTLINDLLALSRIKRKGQPFVRVDLTTVVQDVLSVLETRMEPLGARVELGELPPLDADPAQMSQLFQNLIANALKFHRQDQAPVVKIYSRLLTSPEGNSHPSPLCRITVEDNSIGFDERYLDRIFQVFQRLHSRAEYEGTGVGPAICRHIVERHGGSITANSAPGEGAKFIVTLPLTQPAGEPDHEKKPTTDHDTLCRR